MSPVSFFLDFSRLVYWILTPCISQWHYNWYLVLYQNQITFQMVPNFSRFEKKINYYGFMVLPRLLTSQKVSGHFRSCGVATRWENKYYANIRCSDHMPCQIQSQCCFEIILKFLIDFGLNFGTCITECIVSISSFLFTQNILITEPHAVKHRQKLIHVRMPDYKIYMIVNLAHIDNRFPAI